MNALFNQMPTNVLDALRMQVLMEKILLFINNFKFVRSENIFLLIELCIEIHRNVEYRLEELILEPGLVHTPYLNELW